MYRLQTTRLISRSIRLHPQCYYATTPRTKDTKDARTAGFNKTGERPQDPTDINVKSDEYSKSGGDDVVSEQERASFKNAQDTNPESEKATAGRGNVVNPLEFSPATPELSQYFDDKDVSKSAERRENAKTGQGISKKAKTVEKKSVDFRP